MNSLISWMHIFSAVFIFVVIAVITSVQIKKIGLNLKEMKNRSFQTELIIGAVSNIIILGIIVLMLILLDQKSIGALGLFLSMKGAIFTNIAVITIFLSAIVYVGRLKNTGNFLIIIRSPVNSRKDLIVMLEGIIVLLIIAIQEEVLFRGYITINLSSYGSVVIISVSTILFTAVHVMTNKVSVYQVVTWLLSGVVFSYAYLITKTIWIPVILHFATDLINMIVFNILGRYSLFAFSPPMQGKHRAVYKLVYTIIIFMILTGFYGFLTM